jgi:hypothetical protein
VTTRKFELLSATLIPKLTTAAAARLRRLSVKDSPDDAIAFVLTYAIQPKGLPIQMRIEIPITFYPSGYVIAGALSLGTGAGWLATLLLMFAAGRPKSWKVLGRALVLGLLLSLIAFFLAFLAYSTGCGLQLFGLDVNPLDELVLFAMGLICGCAALLKVDELLKAIDGAFSKMNLSSASTALSFFLLAFLLCPSARAEAHRLPLAGLSACPDGDVIGLDRDGTVIQFSSASPGAWRRAGRVERSMTPAELVCATVDGKKTAFVVGMALGNIWVVRMDLSSGVWMQKMVAGGTSAGIAFDPNSQLLFLSSANVRAIYSMNAGLANPSQWAPVFNSAESIGSLAVDPAGQRLLVGEAFSGVIYALPLGAGRQSTLVQGMGTVNSLSVDSSRNLLYVADAGRHTVWSVPLAGDGPRKLRAFYHSDELKAVSGVAADAQSNVWVALFSKPDVVVLGPDGKQLSTIP